MLEHLQLPIHVDISPLALVPRDFETAMRVLRAIQYVSRRISEYVITAFVRIATLPYYRLYQFNTRSPLQNIARLASETPTDDVKLLRALLIWRARKTAELQFTTISCTVLAAAVIGAFSWTTVEEAHWLTHGLWHSSLILAVLGILLSASEVTVLYILGPTHSSTVKPHQLKPFLTRYQPLLLSLTNNPTQIFVPRRKMVFTWQGPLMFMSYSVCTFLAGLTVLVCTPLIRFKRDDCWNAGHNIAVIYLAVFAFAGSLFIFCSFWVYHYIDSGMDAEEDFALDDAWSGQDRRKEAP
ncbi:hypothetical protein BU23DRAFT_500977 [Bimuria novae-zelandiae CBS 107.79]|uniref:Transmembrane protein n=1 Tax=Bimuria novae-zelandiae CBS 107.79 TaxID=1447943 RepID=A0A6A5VVC2_9PLEO|nr:hypothetical protein BU23DRAFT_500977 [Bimuria novae-zelandiae CBS 107.79]